MCIYFHLPYHIYIYTYTCLFVLQQKYMYNMFNHKHRWWVAITSLSVVSQLTSSKATHCLIDIQHMQHGAHLLALPPADIHTPQKPTRLHATYGSCSCDTKLPTVWHMHMTVSQLLLHLAFEHICPLGPDWISFNLSKSACYAFYFQLSCCFIYTRIFFFNIMNMIFPQFLL